MHRASALVTALLALLTAFQAHGAEKVVLQLRWDHQFQFAGFYAAEWQGYYDEAGLDVEIRTAFSEDWKYLNAADEVSAGRADFGVTASDLLLGDAEKVPLVALAPIFQESPLVILARKGSSLEKPRDLAASSLALVSRGNIGEAEIKAMLFEAGLDPVADFPKVEVIKKGIQALIEGRVEAVAGYSIQLEWLNRVVDGGVTHLKPSIFGLDFYGDTLFTRRDLVDARPDMVSAFVEASLKGWRYALTHGQEIADRIAGDLPRRIEVPDLAAFNRAQVNAVTALTHYPVVPLGTNDLGRWQRIHATLKAVGMASGAPPTEAFVYDPKRDEAARQAAVRSIMTAVVLVAGLVVAAAVAWLWHRWRVEAKSAEVTRRHGRIWRQETREYLQEFRS